MARFILMQDPAEKASSVEFFADAKDVNSVPQVAEAFGVCPQTIRRLIASGELEAVHIGRSVRVTRKAMIDFITRQEVKTYD